MIQLTNHNPLTVNEPLFPFHLDIIAQHIRKKSSYLEEFGDAYPFIVHQSRIRDFRITYINNIVDKELQITQSEVLKYGLSIWHELYPKLSLQFVQHVSKSNLGNLKRGHVLKYSQQIRPQYEKDCLELTTYRKLLNENEFISITYPTHNNFPQLNVISGDQKYHASNSFLSKRESEILDLVFSGYNSKKIGEKLFITKNTVDTHRRNIIKKLGASNIMEAYSIVKGKGKIIV